MTGIYIAFLLLIVICLLLIAFFLFCIWRAVLGKSTVDLALNTTLNINTKRVEALTKNLGEYANTNQGLIKAVGEAKDYLKQSLQAKKDADIKRNSGMDWDRTAK